MSEEKKDDFWSENPYMKQADQTSTSTDWTRQNESPTDSVYASYETGYDTINEDVFGETKKPVFFTTGRIICLIFFLIAVVSIVISVIFTQNTKNRAVKLAHTLNFSEKHAADTISIYDNSSIYLPEYAYTIASKDTFSGFPAGMKLIAVPFQIKSESYQRDHYPLRYIFIGFSKDGEDELYYKEPAREDITDAYLMGYEFKNDFRYQGNGNSCVAFAFFFVPEEMNSCTLYIEKHKEEFTLESVETRYDKVLQVLPYDEEFMETLNTLAGKEDF